MYTIGKFAKKLGITVHTLRVWDKKNRLKPEYVSNGGHRYYSEEQLKELIPKLDVKKENRINIGYVRVSAKHQKDDLQRQYQVMELFLAQKGKSFKIISDIGSGINYKKKGLSELLILISTNQVDRLYIVHKDRLVRFGYELIEKICEIHDVKIEVINQSEVKTDEQEMIDDILNIIHVFSCRMNGKRSHINKKIMEKLKNESTD
jgi:predicted site-specific integrase-resolvase